MNKYKFLKLFIIYLVLSLVSIYFLVPGFCHKMALPTHADNYIAAGILVHNIQALASFNFSNLYHFPIFYPYSFTLTAGVNFFGQSLLLVPFYLTGFKNIYFLYNAMLVLSLILGGFSVYFLTKDFVKKEFISITAGALYIFLPMKQINYPHPAIMFFPLSILAVYFLLRYTRENRTCHVTAFYICLFLQALFSLSLFFLTSIFCVVLFVIFLLVKRNVQIKTFVKLGLGLILLAALMLAVFYPYLSNPLEIAYQKQELSKTVLISSLNFYSSWFPLTFKFLRGRPSPLYLGITASFLIFFFFYSKTKAKLLKPANYAFLILLVLPVFFVFWRKIPLENLYKMLDVLFIGVILFFSINTFLIWKQTSTKERILLVGIVFTFLNYFKALFRFIPFKYNFLNGITLFLPQINRLKGEWKLRYFFIFLWILLAFLGFKALSGKIKLKNRRALLIGFISVLLIFENFPPPLRTGPLLENRPAVRNLYDEIKDYPDHCGVLELPHYKGGWNDLKIYSLMTIYHNKHVYNGFYGAGIFDTLDIFKREYFHPAESIPDDVTNEKIIHYLRDNGIRILVFHKSMLVIGEISGEDKLEKKQHMDQCWSEVIAGFKKAKRIGLLSKVEVLPEGIVGLIKEKSQGKTFQYQLPYYSLKSRKHIRVDIQKASQKALKLSIQFNGVTVYDENMDRMKKQILIKVPEKKSLNPRGNILKIKSSEEIRIQGFSLI